MMRAKAVSLGAIELGNIEFAEILIKTRRGNYERRH